jgi:hypothetical protein
MKHLFALIIVLGYVITATAQNTGRIEGVVLDNVGNGLKGVSIDILDTKGAATGRAVLTLVDGRYAMIGLAPGRYNLQYTYSGYATVIVHGVIVTTDHDTEVNLHLRTSSGKEIETVEYKHPFMNRMPRYLK